MHIFFKTYTEYFTVSNICLIETLNIGQVGKTRISRIIILDSGKRVRAKGGNINSGMLV